MKFNEANEEQAENYNKSFRDYMAAAKEANEANQSQGQATQPRLKQMAEAMKKSGRGNSATADRPTKQERYLGRAL